MWGRGSRKVWLGPLKEDEAERQTGDPKVTAGPRGKRGAGLLGSLGQEGRVGGLRAWAGPFLLGAPVLRLFPHIRENPWQVWGQRYCRSGRRLGLPKDVRRQVPRTFAEPPKPPPALGKQAKQACILIPVCQGRPLEC